MSNKKYKWIVYWLSLIIIMLIVYNACLFSKLERFQEDTLANLQTIYDVQIKQRDSIEDIYNYTFGLTELYTEKQMSCQELEQAYNILREKHVQEALLLDEIICWARRYDIPKCTNYE